MNRKNLLVKLRKRCNTFPRPCGGDPVERYRWQIFRSYSGMEWEGLLGQDPGYVAAELQRRLEEALTVDDRVTGVKNFSYTVQGQALTASFTVSTIYGEMQASTEVNTAA